MGVPPDAIKDVLGVDKTLKYYVKTTEERKKVSALPKVEEKIRPIWAYLLGISRHERGNGKKRVR